MPFNTVLFLKGKYAIQQLLIVNWHAPQMFKKKKKHMQMFYMSFHLKPFLKHGALSSFTKARTSRQKNHYGYSTCSWKPAISGLKTEKRLAVSNSKPSDSEPRQFSMFSIRQWLIFKIRFSRGLHLPTTHEAPTPPAAKAGSARK